MIALLANMVAEQKRKSQRLKKRKDHKYIKTEFYFFQIN